MIGFAISGIVQAWVPRAGIEGALSGTGFAPIVLAYRKYYGTAFALRITALMLVTIIVAALVVDGVFGLVGLVPTGPRPTRTDVFGQIGLNYKLALNVAATAIFIALFWLSRGHSGGHACHHHNPDSEGQEAGEPDPAGV